MKIIKQFKGGALKITLTSLIAALCCTGIIYAATTVGTNISTTGTLTTSNTNTLYGATSIGGAITATSTLNVTGLTTLVNASSTLLSISGTGYIGGATGLILSDGSILDASGAISFGDDNLTTTGLTTLGNASTTVLSVSGNSYLATTTLTGDLTVTGKIDNPVVYNHRNYVPLIATQLNIPYLSGNVFNFDLGAGADPTTMAYDGRYIWVTMATADAVRKIDTLTTAVVTTVSTGFSASDYPTGISYDGHGGIWVSCGHSDSSGTVIRKIDTATNTVVENVTTGAGARMSAYDHVNDRIYVVNRGDMNITVINATTNAVLQTIDLSNRTPSSLTFDGTYMWATLDSSDEVIKIDISDYSIDDTIAVTDYPNVAAYDGTHLWVFSRTTDQDAPGTVSIINVRTDTIEQTLPLGAGVRGVAFDGSFMWAVLKQSHCVQRINIVTKRSDCISTGANSYPFGAVYDGTYVWVTNNGSDDIWRFPTGTDIAGGRIVQGGVTAYAGGGQANATQITGDIVTVTTVTTDNDSVKLPQFVVPGTEVLIHNHDIAQDVAVFPGTSGYINSLAINTAHPVGELTSLWCIANTSFNWECMPLGR